MQWKTHDVLFMSSISAAIRTMREHKINDTLIGCILSEVRGAAVNAEQFRIKDVLTKSPPEFYPHGEYCDRLPPNKEFEE